MELSQKTITSIHPSQYGRKALLVEKAIIFLHVKNINCYYQKTYHVDINLK
ncbi:hypothetical protein BD31_I2083 [Candidatus Nitrosopumilus salaria BD31]|uniref:Uncharacterized protein n=1 Tax=Candidatus Nitrosopumilus salarius BD31 TaxID=859350 RepID=I3D483_9ARCH|nr:hypothetical protein BD31_I2083 [Candidatus Nitrosopumilus salaria BD31]